MRKLLISMIAIVALGTGAAFAQTGTWAGVSLGWPGAALHFGLENVAPNLDVRANLGYTYIGTGGFSFGVDALYNLNLDTGMAPLSTYVGGGLGLGFGAGFSAGIGLLAGAEYRLIDAGLPEGGVFFEVGPTIGLAGGFAFGFAGRLGFNYHF
jgi:hypothetical protein